MFHEALSKTNLTDLPIVALLLFFAIFAVISVRVLLRGKDDPTTQHLASLPLDDDVTPARTPDLPTPPSTPDDGDPHE